MNTAKHCRACRTADMREITYGEELTVKGVDLYVDGLVAWVCPECHAQVETAEQMDRNAETVKAAFTHSRASFKQEYGLLSGEEIRTFRTEFKLTQKEAASLFGGGPNAFPKYEAETIIQNKSMDNLLRLAIKEPSYIKDIAEIAKIQLSDKTIASIRNYYETKYSELLSSLSSVIEKPVKIGFSAITAQQKLDTAVECSFYPSFDDMETGHEEFFEYEQEQRMVA